MSVYNILFGMGLGLLLFLILYCFKYKRLSPLKQICMAGIFVYSGFILSLTVEIIFPHQMSFDPRAFTNIQYIPFVGIVEVFQNVQRSGNYSTFIRLVGGNLFLFTPLGFLFPIVYKKCTLKYMILLGFLMSLFIETMQFVYNLVSGDSNISLFAKRVVEIDDLILNTAGALIGYLCFVVVKYLYSKIFRKRVS